MSLFTEQAEEYIEALFEDYDPDRKGTARSLLENTYRGKESHLISALEQQYNVNHWRLPNLREKLIIYYEQMAPGRMEEVDVLLTRFRQREEQLWQYVISRYGPAPSLQSAELRKYLTDRLRRYLSKRAQHLIKDAPLIVAQCSDNGESIFSRLTREYGTEDPDEVRESIERRLSNFYSKRHMRRALDNAHILAQRFTGRESMLNELLMAKFGDTMGSYMPDTSDLVL